MNRLSSLARRASILLAVPLLAATLVACGDDSDGGSTGGGTDAPAPTQLNVTTSEFTFEFDAESVPAGAVEVVQTNEGKEPHQVQFVQLTEGATADEFGKSDFQKSFELVESWQGGPGASSGVPPGETMTQIIDLPAGNYVVICIVHGHIAEGMYAEFEVTEPEGEAAVADVETDGVITAKDFEVVLPEGFTGQGTFEVVNDGPSVHEVAFYKLEGATLEEVEKFLEGGGKGRPPGTSEPAPAYGASFFESGETEYVELDLEPGVYAALCFYGEPGGKVHFELGMATPFEVQ